MADLGVCRLLLVGIGWALFSLPMYHNCVRLPRSGFHVYSVDSCPRNLSEVEAASRKLNCSENPTSKYLYHCLPRFDLSHLVEFCYDDISGLIQEGNCMVLYTQTMTNHHCNHFTKGCPDKPYFAKDIFNYPACIDIDRQKKCYLMDPNCTSTASIPEATPALQQDDLVLLGWIAAGVMTPFALFGIIVIVLLIKVCVQQPTMPESDRDRNNGKMETTPPNSDKNRQQTAERTTSDDADKQTDTVGSMEDTKKYSEKVVGQSTEVLTAGDSRVNQGSDNSSEAETPGDKDSDSTQEPKDLDNQSSPEKSSQKSETESRDNNLPQDSITSTDNASNVQQDQRHAEKPSESPPQVCSSQNPTASPNQEDVSKQKNQPATERTGALSTPHSEEERMNVDNGAEKAEPTDNMDSCTESTPLL